MANDQLNAEEVRLLNALRKAEDEILMYTVNLGPRAPEEIRIAAARIKAAR